MEQFLYALTQEGRYTLLKSPGISHLVSDMNFHLLRKYPNAEEPLWLGTEQIVAVQFVEYPTVAYRGGLWNHTFLIPLREYIGAVSPHQLLAPYVLHATDPLPLCLHAIQLPCSSSRTEYPPREGR